MDSEDAVRLIAARAPEEVHWTVVLDDALKAGLVPPSPDARADVQHALAAAVNSGKIEKTATGTYRAR